MTDQSRLQFRKDDRVELARSFPVRIGRGRRKMAEADRLASHSEHKINAACVGPRAFVLTLIFYGWANACGRRSKKRASGTLGCLGCTTPSVAMSSTGNGGGRWASML
jgi:hypothetical protein